VPLTTPIDVRSTDWRYDPTMETAARRIVVPTDFSQTADHALSKAIEMARALPAQLCLIHVHSPVVVLPPPIDMVSLTTVFPKALEQMGDALEERSARVRDAGVACEAELIEGSPPAEIVGFADRSGAELIVMGTHGRGGLAHAVLGSVTERVIHRAPCPVLVVPDRKR
jgi:nucleotide-binding universal stress UspA family protein